MAIDPRFAELAAMVALNTASDEEKLEYKALKKAAKIELKSVFSPENAIKNLEKKITALQSTIEFIRVNGCLPEKAAKTPVEGGKRRGRPAKVTTEVSE